MAIIYLSHFIHGTKVATLEAEAEYDEKHGWVRYNPATVSEPDEPVQDELVQNELIKRKYTRKVVTEGV